MTQAGNACLLVANWKSNLSLSEAIDFVKSYPRNLDVAEKEVVVCPSLVYVWPVREIMLAQQTPIKLGIQDVSEYDMGAYTGACAVIQVADWIEYVIVGHSERRQYFLETHQQVVLKARQALSHGITPIVCVDEPYMKDQLELFHTDELEKIVVAYEPLAAIGSGKTDSPEHASEVASHILQLTGTTTRVIYGGSVTAENVSSFVDQASISGVLVGGASLKLESWISLVSAA